MPQLFSTDRFAFLQAGWHADIVGRGREGFLAEMSRQGVPAEATEIFDVPGAYEIPLLAQTLARSGRFKAIIACALVVDGGLYRHDFVATAVIDGMMRVQLDTGVPVLSAVLTPHHFHEHAEHQRFFAEHFLLKGAEVARAALAAVALQRQAVLQPA
ncbi:6,7-dimethyl-8-ribityllumazine synthase [Roseomonas sp. 18066]|uniref:6,7-dimethyl-8-ribityllumazine synthase n=1 Tax=Roseomonas sp. 18066 TaxID=2681412 RepID=UPI001356EFCB|nr:6,7-dimethyl-8-ribityllumazine synthase [Roseomonas sp. 18066]